MSTKLPQAHPKRGATKKAAQPVVLKNWDEVAAYKAKHLKPVRYGPKGQPIYDHEEVEALNIRLADPS